ncbi:peptide-methionine (R)-S-oxide reductase MsrB [archaeon]|jgi:peptide-methionine (R)-S-oxide reductase|nr:peptide-methionine (R)-S-oxide reductase MsrB [Candidatus Woesearchaeota archaeon]MBT4136060.1 peptide-methionine (R)-S-oxide reductase MsrB [archaeon]MBT4241285.1 peptide-methionine (R)-S-oxide reductase MsrB [archaeon]MBT4418107.1 peptide-methionine (R)-S-oxide reductase MsrB [archaeon]
MSNSTPKPKPPIQNPTPASLPPTPNPAPFSLPHTTEPAGSGKLLHNKETGNYFCANCKNPLFNSKEKFDSGSGWPSFFNPFKDAVEFKPDKLLGIQRTEVICNKCKIHLGHFFKDGPKNSRYCINSKDLNFEKKK